MINHFSILCIDLRVLPNISKSEGTSMLDIDDFNEIPDSFFFFQTIELKPTKLSVRFCMDSNSPDPDPSGSFGNSLTSTELVPYNVELR